MMGNHDADAPDKDVDPKLDKVTDRTIAETTYKADAKSTEEMSEEQEIAARTTDTDETTSRHYTKKFVVSEPYDKEQADAFYGENVHQMASVVQDAINVGLRADGDVEYVGSYPHPTADTAYIVEYRVPAVRAQDSEAWTMSPTAMIDAGSGDEADAHAMTDAAVKNAQANTPAEKKDAAEASDVAASVTESNADEKTGA